MYPWYFFIQLYFWYVWTFFHKYYKKHNKTYFWNVCTREKKLVNKIAKIQQLFPQRSGYISDFTLIYPEKNLADFRGFNSTNRLPFKKN